MDNAEGRLLDISGLRTYFYTEEGIVKAVDGIDLKINKNEIHGLVGESGCGKTVTGLSILRLVPKPGKIVGGKILFHGEDLLLKREAEIRKIRGSRISMIFQDPLTSLNPVFSVGDQVAEAIECHQKITKTAIKKKVIELFGEVGIPDSKLRYKAFPHQFSGGMRQRVMIAMVVSSTPDLLIADEPTSNLDVTIQAQVLDIMRKLQKEFHTSILLITHDLGVIAEMCDKVSVMYSGKIMEVSEAESIFGNPQHPYTKALLSSIPRPDLKVKRLRVIPGMVPRLIDLPQGCRFHPRCRYKKEECKEKIPSLVEVNSGHFVCCIRAGEV